MFKFLRRRRHKADQYFKYKFRQPMGREARNTVYEAYSIRHQYPDLDGPELVRLVYWGASGTRGEA